MKFLSQKPIPIQGWGKPAGWQAGEKIQLKLQSLHRRYERWVQRTGLIGSVVWQFLQKVKQTGVISQMDEYERRKLSIFNQLNFLQLITGIIVPLTGMYRSQQFPVMVWVVSMIPPMVSILVLWLNARYQHFLALMAYFLLYPFAMGLVYLSGVNLGVGLSFVLYGILSVFFLQDISQMLFVVGLSMISYFILDVVCKSYTYQLATSNTGFYYFNQLLAIGFIFYGLWLIKKENSGYQQSILLQKEEIWKNEQILKQQTEELLELNALKNKLFTIIAHDLKAPMYALRNLFRNMQQYDLPAEEIKGMVPDVAGELEYTTGLMENLLHWARSQMQADAVKGQPIDLGLMITEVVRLLRLQAETKQIRVKVRAAAAAVAYADQDMVGLVLRNLLSNAIKYTPEKGAVDIGVHKLSSGVEVYVTDTGKGITPEALQQINQHQYYTTKGTAGESGTGLGLMLCKEFLVRNGGKMHIESIPGKGSTFSFTLPSMAAS